MVLAPQVYFATTSADVISLYMDIRTPITPNISLKSMHERVAEQGKKGLKPDAVFYLLPALPCCWTLASQACFVICSSLIFIAQTQKRFLYTDSHCQLLTTVKKHNPQTCHITNAYVTSEQSSSLAPYLNAVTPNKNTFKK